ncbi:MAG: TetR/AcrR family transcriptional regulator [Ignavibacteria bacterium]|jgi:AcrR family transcriptional regulator|nr:TetR/AcrR family transcriptional regulator [Ignavibacteria bacterium]MDH7528888.1 TetR/AcrR family transcriptional regulator [Ignavibacteria bacterium]
MRKNDNSISREKILEIARYKFFTDGFFKTSIDEIAREYHISKKTIYKHFKSKDDLLTSVVKKFTGEVTDSIIEIMKSDKNSIEKLLNVLNLIQNSIRQFSLRYVDDIQKHKPKLWNYIEKFRKENLEKIVYQTIEAGKKEGLFNDVNPDIVFRIFYGAVRNVLNPEFLITSPISRDEALNETFEILLNGVLTNEGKKLYKKQKKGN